MCGILKKTNCVPTILGNAGRGNSEIHRHTDAKSFELKLGEPLEALDQQFKK